MMVLTRTKMWKREKGKGEINKIKRSIAHSFASLSYYMSAKKNRRRKNLESN
jgi:hypothetical protein